jgi:hypothetical protein
VIDVEPAAWFDYGYRRTTTDPTGKGPGADKYYARPGEKIVLSPVRFLVGYDRSHADTGVSYSWSVSGGSFSSPASGSGEFFSFTPTAPGTSTVTVQITGKSYITGNQVTVSATTELVCFTEVTGQTTAPPYRLLDHAPGQYAVAGSGYGWSLGCVGGYEVWAVSHQSSYKITGNGFGTWVEPGVVWIQEDRNGNNKPDEMWYELKGSDDGSAVYKNMITRRFAVTFIDTGDNEILDEYKHIYWVDSRGRADLIRSKWHDTWPAMLTYTTTLLRDTGLYDGVYQHAVSDGGTLSGYVDVMGSDSFPVDRAIRADGSSVSLSNVRFIKVQTSVFGYGGVFGDFSTEIYSADYLGQQTTFPLPE